MNRTSITAVVAIATLGLAACGDHDGRMVNHKICATFKAANAGQTGVPAMPAAATDAASPVDECVRRWAYSLAGATDTAQVVADAAVAACGAALTRWNQGSLSQQSQSAAGAEALSLTTGQPTNALAEHNIFAHNRALFYVVQARAGQCKPPPAVNGVPAGV